MILGIGIDGVEIARVDWKKLGDRVFSPKELEYLRQKGAAAAESAAGMFAAKEAALKAAGTGIGPLSLRDVWVEHEPCGRPVLGYSETFQSTAGFDRAHLSITHTKDLAFAQVILEKN